MASMWSFALWSKVLPKSMGAASLNDSSSSTRVANSGFRCCVAFCLRSLEILAEAFPNSLRACWADSAASLVFSVPFLADSSMLISGHAASRTSVCIRAEARSASLAGLGSLDSIVLSSLGHFV